MEKNKTINIPYSIHKKLKLYCTNNDLKLKDFLVKIINREIERDINRKDNN